MHDGARIALGIVAEHHGDLRQVFHVEAVLMAIALRYQRQALRSREKSIRADHIAMHALRIESAIAAAAPLAQAAKHGNIICLAGLDRTGRQGQCAA